MNIEDLTTEYFNKILASLNKNSAYQKDSSLRDMKDTLSTHLEALETAAEEGNLGIDELTKNMRERSETSLQLKLVNEELSKVDPTEYLDDNAKEIIKEYKRKCLDMIRNLELEAMDLLQESADKYCAVEEVFNSCDRFNKRMKMLGINKTINLDRMQMVGRMGIVKRANGSMNSIKKYFM